MSKRNTRAAKAARREARAKAVPPSYLESDESYLNYILATPGDQLTDRQRELAREIRAHHPEL